MQNSVQVRQHWSIIKIGKSILANDSVNVRLRFSLYIRVEYHCKKEYEQCGRSLSRGQNDYDVEM